MKHRDRDQGERRQEEKPRLPRRCYASPAAVAWCMYIFGYTDKPPTENPPKPVIDLVIDLAARGFQNEAVKYIINRFNLREIVAKRLKALKAEKPKAPAEHLEKKLERKLKTPVDVEKAIEKLTEKLKKGAPPREIEESVKKLLKLGDIEARDLATALSRFSRRGQVEPEKIEKAIERLRKKAMPVAERPEVKQVVERRKLILPKDLGLSVRSLKKKLGLKA